MTMFISIGLLVSEQASDCTPVSWRGGGGGGGGGGGVRHNRRRSVQDNDVIKGAN